MTIMHCSYCLGLLTEMEHADTHADVKAMIAASAASSTAIASAIADIYQRTHNHLTESALLTTSFAGVLRDASVFGITHAEASVDAADDMVAKMEALHEEMKRAKALQKDLDAAHRAVTSLEQVLSEMEAMSRE